MVLNVGKKMPTHRIAAPGKLNGGCTSKYRKKHHDFRTQFVHCLRSSSLKKFELNQSSGSGVVARIKKGIADSVIQLPTYLFHNFKLFVVRSKNEKFSSDWHILIIIIQTFIPPALGTHHTLIYSSTNI